MKSNSKSRLWTNTPLPTVYVYSQSLTYLKRPFSCFMFQLIELHSIRITKLKNKCMARKGYHENKENGKKVDILPLTILCLYLKQSSIPLLFHCHQLIADGKKASKHIHVYLAVAGDSFFLPFTKVESSSEPVVVTSLHIYSLPRRGSFHELPKIPVKTFGCCRKFTLQWKNLFDSSIIC